MEIYVYAAKTLETVNIIGRFADLRISHRYDEPGDLEIKIPIDASVELFPGMFIWPTTSKEVFVIDTTRIEETEEGDMMHVHAWTASALLGWRVLHVANVYEGSGGAIVKQMLDSVWSDARRRFALFSYDIDAALGDSITYEVQPINLLVAIGNVCKANGLGFRTLFNPITKTMVFQLVNGVDRTKTSQGIHPAVFDYDYENITKMDYTDTTEGTATVIYVMGEISRVTEERLWLEHDPAALSGYDRMETVVESGKTSMTDDKDEEGNSIIMTGPEYYKLLADYGGEKLAAMKRSTVTEGDLVAESGLIRYGEDYEIGDIVIVRNRKWAVSVEARIKEAEESFAGGVYRMRLIVGDRAPTLEERITRK